MKIYNFDGKQYNNLSTLNDTLHKKSLGILLLELQHNQDNDVCNLIKREYLRRMNTYTGR